MKKGRTLYLPLKAIYFDQIKAGTKHDENRLAKPYWEKRLAGREYDLLVLTRGYPKGGGVEGETRLTRAYVGYTRKKIVHMHFGPDEVEVFAIDVRQPAAAP